MAVKLRLMRMGKKKQPTYRIVAADARSPRDGRFLEIVGIYDARQDPSALTVDNDKAVKWLRNGAQPTETVEKLLKISGAWEAFTGEAPPPPPVAKSKAEKKAEKKAAEKAAQDEDAATQDAATQDAATQDAETQDAETQDAETQDAEASPDDAQDDTAAPEASDETTGDG